MEETDVLLEEIKRPVPVKVERISDLTPGNLTKIFQHYFRDKNLALEITKDSHDFLGQNDQFQSEIKRWEVRVQSSNGTTQNVSFIAKTTVEKGMQQFNTRITRQFFTETFWYKYAMPVLKREFPEIASISPTYYYAFSNYEDSYRPDYCDRHCGLYCRAFHHKNELGILLLENACEEKRHTGFPSIFHPLEVQ